MKIEVTITPSELPGSRPRKPYITCLEIKAADVKSSGYSYAWITHQITNQVYEMTHNMRVEGDLK